MKKLKLWIKLITVYLTLILCGTLFACTEPSPSAKTLTELFDETKSAVAQITVQSNYGTAFAIEKTDDALYVMTNLHTFPSIDGVIFGDSFSLIFYNGEKASTQNNEAKLIGYNTYHDIAIIRIDKISEAYAIEPLKYATTKTNVGDSLFTIGNSNNSGLALFTGVMSIKVQSLNVNSSNKTVPVMQITVPINSGNSGCPVLDYDGKVIGIGTYRNDSHSSMYYCVPFDLAKTYMNTIISANGNGENKATATASKIKLINGSTEKFKADYGIYGFQGILYKSYIEVTYVPDNISDYALSGSPILQLGDKITYWGAHPILGLDIFDIMLYGEQYTTDQASDRTRLELSVMRGDEEFTFTYKSIFTKND